MIASTGVQGRSTSPVYLHVNDGDVELLPAAPIWGTTVWHTEEWLKSHHQNPQLKAASIGEAGENGVYYACGVNDLHRGRDPRPFGLPCGRVSKQ